MHMHAMRVSQREIINAASEQAAVTKRRRRANTRSEPIPFALARALSWIKAARRGCISLSRGAFRVLNPASSLSARTPRVAQRPFTFIAFFSAQRFSTFLNAFVESFAISFFLNLLPPSEVGKWDCDKLSSMGGIPRRRDDFFKPDCRREQRKMRFRKLNWVKICATWIIQVCLSHVSWVYFNLSVMKILQKCHQYTSINQMRKNNISFISAYPNFDYW